MLKVQNLLEQAGCTVILTRSDENAIYEQDAKTLRQKKVSDIKNRVKIGNSSSADILNEAIKRENKRVPLKLDNVYIMKNVEIPTSIVECGFLSNPEEEKNLLNDEYQNRLAWGIYTGITNYFYE